MPVLCAVSMLCALPMLPALSMLCARIMIAFAPIMLMITPIAVRFAWLLMRSSAWAGTERGRGLGGDLGWRHVDHPCHRLMRNRCTPALAE